jgi:protein ImuB
MLWIAVFLPNLAREASPLRPEAHFARESIETLAGWAGRFTPNVSLQRDCGLLLEIAASLKLFGDLHALISALRTDLAAMKYTAYLAGAPTARAAWWLAQSRTEQFIENTADLETTLAELPIAVLDGEADTLAALDAIGARMLGDVLRLPRDGLARRFGQSLLDELDQALGRKFEPRCFFAPPARFRARLELAAEVEEAEALAFAARRLLVQLEGFLAARAGGVSRFTFALRHRGRRMTEVSIGLAAPARDAGHFTLLLRERLARLPLVAPVRALVLTANEIVPLADDNLMLFRDGVSAASHWPKFIERLRARLGAEQAHGLVVGAEHRPECASLVGAFGVLSSAADFGLRPLWLLPEPQPLAEIGGVPQHGGPLKLLAGPERIESGWWDNGSVARDYFVAQTTERQLLWVFRRRELVAVDEAGWYLHGLFA